MPRGYYDRTKSKQKKEQSVELTKVTAAESKVARRQLTDMQKMQLALLLRDNGRTIEHGGQKMYVYNPGWDDAKACTQIGAEPSKVDLVIWKRKEMFGCIDGERAPANGAGYGKKADVNSFIIGRMTDLEARMVALEELVTGTTNAKAG